MKSSRMRAGVAFVAITTTITLWSRIAGHSAETFPEKQTADQARSTSRPNIVQRCCDASATSRVKGNPACCQQDAVGQVTECQAGGCKYGGDTLEAAADVDFQARRRGRSLGQGRGRGMGPGARHASDEQFEEDHNVLFFLLDHRDAIRRSVKNLPDGIETVTESENAEIAVKIQAHVAAMYARLEKGNPIHMRDPLFRELFAHAKQIKMETEHTDNGIRVKETATDPYVVQLLQEHAKTVSLFIKHGRSELHRNHVVPKRPVTN